MLHVKSFTCSPIQENTYIVYSSTKEAAIIDPGCYFDYEKEALYNFIATEGLTVTYLLNTHCHLDHVFGNKDVAAKYHVPLHTHALEAPVLAYATTSGLHFNLPFDNYTGTVHYLTIEDVITLGNHTLTILHTPGHSPGSISFYSKEYSFIVSGDVLFKQSIGRTDLPGGNLEQLLQSIHTQLYTLPPSTTVYSGHGGPTTIAHEIAYNPYTIA